MKTAMLCFVMVTLTGLVGCDNNKQAEKSKNPLTTLPPDPGVGGAGGGEKGPSIEPKKK